MPTNLKLKSIDQKLRSRNLDARNDRIETGAVVTSRRGLSGIERGQGVCCQWKAKRAVFERETNAVSGTTVMSVQKTHTKKTATHF